MVQNLHPVLQQLAGEIPDELVRIIVQKSGQNSEAEESVRTAGGHILRNFSFINAFVAEIPALEIQHLAGDPAIRWVSLDAPVQRSTDARQESDALFTADHFEAAGYSGGEGTYTWTEPWSEIGEVDGAELGNVLVTRFLGGTQQGLRIRGSMTGIQRFLNLENTHSATLSFSFRRKGMTDANQYVTIQVSADDGQSWNEIGRISGPGTDATLETATYDISDYATSTTGVRFLSSTSMTEANRLYVDNVNIAFKEQSADEVTYNDFTLYLPQVMSGGSLVVEQDPVPSRNVIDQVETELVTNRQIAVDNRPSFLDQFDTRSYQGNNGTGKWSSQWQEFGESQNATRGFFKILNSSRCYSGYCLRIGADPSSDITVDDFYIVREVDLSSAATAELSFVYRQRAKSGGSASMHVDISTDNGTTWTSLQAYGLNNWYGSHQSAKFDISDHISHQTLIRFQMSGYIPRQKDTYVYLDNVKIAYTENNDNSTNDTDTDDPDPDQPDAPAEITQGSVKETFSSYSYGNNDGSLNWVDNWSEIGDNGWSNSGDVWIVNQALIMRDDNNGVVRTFNFPDNGQFTLSFDYRRHRMDYKSDYVTVELSKDGGNSWTEVYRMFGPGSDNSYSTKTIDITPHVSEETKIRFKTSSTFASLDFIYLDNIEISYQCTECGDRIEPEPSPSPSNDEKYVMDGSVKDTFTLDDYGNNDGTIEWIDRWTEINDEGSPDHGDIWVWFYELSMRNGNRGIERSFNFVGDGEATLSFDYQRYSFDNENDYVAIALSSDDGNTWSEVDRIAGPASDSRYKSKRVDISSYVSQETKIRFLTSPSFSQQDYLYLDNIKITYDCTECIDTSSLSSKHVKSLKAHKLWNRPKPLQGQGMTVAVVDSGISEHPDLKNRDNSTRILTHVDFVGSTGTSDDYYGHGTHVAGLIAGNGHYSKGAYMGIAPKANLVDVRVINDFGSGFMSDVVAGLEWVLQHKDEYNIRVANLSLNSSVAESYHVSPLNAALEILWFNGIVVVVSAGNNGSNLVQASGVDNATLFPPANDPFVITVGATDTKGTDDIDDDEVTSFSAWGQTQDGFAKPELVVPGKALVGPLASDDSNLVINHPDHVVPGVHGNNYFNMSGTSMASAVASGAILQLLQDEPNLTPDQVKYRLIDTAKVKNGSSYLRIVDAVNGKSTESANVGIEASRLLFTGSEQPGWDDHNWSSVAWGSVAWGSVAWGSVAWGSVAWGSVDWDVSNIEAPEELSDN